MEKFMNLIWTLFIIENCLLVPVLGFTATLQIDPDSVVGGLGTLQVSFTSDIAFSSSIYISLSPLTFKTRFNRNYITSIDPAAQVSIIDGYTFDDISAIISIAPVSSVPAKTTITILLNHVQYGDSMLPKNLEIRITGAIPESATLSWAPHSPAPILNLMVDKTLYTCDTYTITINGTPSVNVALGSPIAMIFDSAILLTNAVTCSISCTVDTDKNLINTTADEVYGSTVSFSITLDHIKTPAVAQSFSITLETYLQSNPIGLVHEESISYPISARTIPTSNEVNRKSGGSSEVCEPVYYEITIRNPCETISNANCLITPPAIFTPPSTVTVPSMGELEGNQDKVVSFPLNNPCSVIPDSVLTANPFKIVVRDNTNEAFIIEPKLKPGILYTPGIIRDLMVIPSPPRAGDFCDYTFTMTNPHPIPDFGKIKLLLNAAVGISSINKIMVNTQVISSFTAISNEILITLPIGMSIALRTPISIIVYNVENPPGIATYDQFFANTFTKEEYLIDKSLMTVLKITEPGSATITYTANNTQNLEPVKFTFTFGSRTTISNNYFLGIKPPSEVGPCTVDNPVSNPSYDPSIPLWRQPTVTSSNDKSFTFDVTCKNPPTTKPTSDFQFLLYSNTGVKLLLGEQSITTDTGASLALPLTINCSPKYPLVVSTCELNINRQTNTGFQSFLIISDLFVADNSICNYEESGISIQGTCTMTSAREIVLSLNSIRTSTAITIKNLKVNNPDYGGQFPISIKTFTASNIGGYIIDEGKVGDIASLCKYPCETCLTPFVCERCTEDLLNSEPYYLYENKSHYACLPNPPTNCIELFSGACCNGYYKNGDIKQCISCDTAKCSACEGNPQNCTKCKNTNEWLYEGDCSPDNCPEGSYKNLNLPGQICSTCAETCGECDTLDFCTTCKIGFFLFWESNFKQSCINKCPEKYYLDSVTNTCTRCSLLCGNCTNTATECTSCPTGEYLNTSAHTCVTGSECIDGNKYVTIDSTLICAPCSDDCNKCENLVTQCTECKDRKFLTRTTATCSLGCASGFYGEPGIGGIGGICEKCVNQCETCKNQTYCITCEPTFMLKTDTSTCVSTCGNGYYTDSARTICSPCSLTCATCTVANLCVSCKDSKYVYLGSCYNTCPETTFHQGNFECKKCTSNCRTCENTEDKCLTCISGYYLDGSSCVRPCPSDKTPIDGICKSCDRKCSTCSGDPLFCTGCHGNYYAHNGECLLSCPEGFAPSLAQKACIQCPPLCKECSWGSDSTPNICVVCSDGNKFLDNKCYASCPGGYVDTSDGRSCVKSSESNGNGNGNGGSLTEDGKFGDYVPFPHLIAAGLLGIIIAAGQFRDGRALFVSNLIVVINYVAICSYAFQIVWALSEDIVIIAVVTGIVMAIQVFLNICYFFSYKSSISPDAGFTTWAKYNGCTKGIILTLSTVITLQTTRFFYSRFMGFATFYAKFTDYNNIFKPLNRCSLLQICLVHSVIVILNAIELVKLSWGKMLYITLIEALILSLILLLLLSYEMKITESIKQNLTQDSSYSMINDKSGANTSTGLAFDEEKLRKEIADSIFLRLGMPGRSIGADTIGNLPTIPSRNRKSDRRRNSFSGTTSYTKEKDPRKTGSYPCSPRTAKRKEIPLPSNASPLLNGFPDNVYSDSVPPKDPSLSVNPTIDYGCQTPPFQKIEAFRKHMEKQGVKRRRTKMFERSPNPLESIPEKPEEESNGAGDRIGRSDKPGTGGRSFTNFIEEIKEVVAEKPERTEDSPVIEKSSRRTAVIPIILPTGGKKGDSKTSKSSSTPIYNFVETNKSKSGGIEADDTKVAESVYRPASPPQVSDEGVKENMSKPLNPINKEEINRRNNGNLTGRSPAIDNKTLITPNKVPEVFEDDKGFQYSSTNLRDSPPLNEKAVRGRKMEETKIDEDAKRVEDSEQNATQDKKGKKTKGKDDNTGDKNAKANKDDKNPTAQIDNKGRNLVVLAGERNAPKANSRLGADNPIPINDEDIMGIFDKDPVDGCILIRENAEGVLTDLKGRPVNKYGYLIDKDGNIVNQRGEFVMAKDDFERALEDDVDGSRPIMQNNLLHKEQAQPQKKKPIKTEEVKPFLVDSNLPDSKKNLQAEPKKRMFTENEQEEESEARKSVSLDSLMEDTPSNYNIQNQRFNDPLQRSKPASKNLPLGRAKPIEYEDPTEGDIVLAKIYGGKPKGAPKKEKKRSGHNKSAYKRNFEKAFKPVGTNRKYSSEISPDLLDPNKVPGKAAPAVEEETKEVVGKPLTARGNFEKNNNLNISKRSKSRKMNEEEELERAYNGNLEDMFLDSDVDDNASEGSVSRSVVSRISNKSNKLRGLESIYLQRLESSSKHIGFKRKNKKKAKKGKQEKSHGSGSEKDEIASLLSENYKAMQKQFQKSVTAENALNFKDNIKP